ncbi:MAG: FadR/GntR family transcriptional regulator [Polyangiales bacterium]
MVIPVKSAAVVPQIKAKRRAAEEASDKIREQILRGEFAAGSDLPGERELSTRLGVSRLTLRAAVARLEAEGLVKPVHGSGNRVLDFRETGGVELLGHLTALAQKGPDVPLTLLANLLELRRAVAVEAIGLAAERATVEEIAALRGNIDRQASLLHDPKGYIDADLSFARLLSRATHNVALTFLANTIVRVLEKQPGIELAFFVDPQGTLAVYRKFVAVIEARDVQLACTFARRLITKLDRRLLERIAAFGNHGP